MQPKIVATIFRKHGESGKSKSELDYAVRQLVAKAVVTAEDEVIDVFLPVLFFWVRRRRWEKLKRHSPTEADPLKNAAQTSFEGFKHAA